MVWPEEDDSDVRLVPTDSVVETSAFPSAEADDESDEVPASGVSEVESSEGPRPRRRRRRRGGRRPESAAAATDEGTTFDLNEVLDEPGDTADFIPASASEDSAVNDDESESEEGADVSDSDEGRPSERRGRRRRRRRRPDSVGAETDSTPAAEGTFSDEPPLATTTDLDDVDEEDEDEDEVVPVITYAKMPSWEEAIRFLLNPHLVGRNLEPEDEGESLIGDPRGSGGSEPTPPASAQRRYRRSGGGGGGGRGRR